MESTISTLNNWQPYPISIEPFIYITTDTLITNNK